LIAFNISREDAVAAAQQSIEVGVSAERFFEVVTDYERYPEFLSDVESADVVSRGDGAAEVRFSLNLVKRLYYTLRLEEESPRRVVWSLADGPFKRNDGSWLIEELGPDRVRATYSIDVAVGVFVPGAIVNRLVGKTLPTTLENFRVRAESLAAQDS
tara:strand:- start:348 stop:818 length:471 start_codon:yes stop_codon:yes gene_type:complete